MLFAADTVLAELPAVGPAIEHVALVRGEIDTSGATLVFTVSAISGGRFENADTGLAITRFTPQQISDGDVQFVHDGGESAPAYSVAVSDGEPSTIATAASITFTNVNDAPVLDPIAGRSVSEGTVALFTLGATDGDLPAMASAVGRIVRRSRSMRRRASCVWSPPRTSSRQAMRTPTGCTS